MCTPHCDENSFNELVGDTPVQGRIVDDARHIRATVVWAPKEGVPLEVEIDAPKGTTLAQAVQMSGLLNHAQHCQTATLDLGVFNKPQKPDTLLRDGDRVEVYRPLTVDPKEARRIRAQVRLRRATPAKQSA